MRRKYCIISVGASCTIYHVNLGAYEMMDLALARRWWTLENGDEAYYCIAGRDGHSGRIVSAITHTTIIILETISYPCSISSRSIRSTLRVYSSGVCFPAPLCCSCRPRSTFESTLELEYSSMRFFRCPQISLGSLIALCALCRHLTGV